MTWPDGVALPRNEWDRLSGMTPQPPAVSVIVAHYRQPAQLARTLAALAAQTHPGDLLDIIVADDGSPEPPSVPDGVHVVRQADEGFRLAAVRNLGAAQAAGEVLVFLDADTVPEPEFVAELVRMIALSPDVVAVGRRRHADLDGVAPVGDIRAVAADRELPEPRWLVRAYRESRDLRDADDRSYRHIIGAVLACSRALFDVVGGFDESFRAYGGEDWEWAYRAWRHGAVFAHVPAAVAWHDGPDAAGRDAVAQAVKNEEVLRLADLIPVPGSRPRGALPAKVDIAVTAPTGVTPGARFVSLDSVLAALPGAESATMEEVADGAERFDRVRLHVHILRAVRVRGAGLAAVLERVAAEDLGEVLVEDDQGDVLLRVVSERARRRGRRWRRDDLFPTVVMRLTDVRPLVGEPDLEAYLGGWD